MQESKNEWEELVESLSQRFAPGEKLDLDGILFLIGVQELGKGYQKLKKDDKIDLLHVAICTVLMPYGYYKFMGRDPNGWPQFERLEQLPNLKAGEQAVLMKKAVLRYFKGYTAD